MIADNARRAMRDDMTIDENGADQGPAYLQLMEAIESQLEA